MRNAASTAVLEPQQPLYGRMAVALRDMLLCLDPTDAGESRLKLAAATARARQVHVAGVFLLSEIIPGFAPDEGFGLAGAGSIAAASPGALLAGEPVPNPLAQLAEIAEQRFRAELPAALQTDDWHVLGSGDREELIALAKSFDLVVCGQELPDYPVVTGFGPEDIVLACARPVLVVPNAGTFAEIGRRVLIAWDGTREAVRAVHDSLPLIDAAEAVTVISVADAEADFEKWRPAFDRLIRHLGHHGVSAKMEEEVRSDLAVSDLLLSRASDLGADLIVAGAYHRSPAREAWLGGVSRELLDHMTVPVLMSH